MEYIKNNTAKSIMLGSLLVKPGMAVEVNKVKVGKNTYDSVDKLKVKLPRLAEMIDDKDIEKISKTAATENNATMDAAVSATVAKATSTTAAS